MEERASERRWERLHAAKSEAGPESLCWALRKGGPGAFARTSSLARLHDDFLTGELGT